MRDGDRAPIGRERQAADVARLKIVEVYQRGRARVDDCQAAAEGIRHEHAFSIREQALHPRREWQFDRGGDAGAPILRCKLYA
jgi:hypothetical protein